MQRSSINKVILVGHIGNKPEGRFTPSGMSTSTFSIATNESWIDSEKGKQERTEWHNIVAWNKLADFASEYLQKGQLVYVEGKLQTRDWEDSEGKKRYTTEVVAREMTMLDSKGDSMESSSSASSSSKPDNDKTEEDIPF